MSTNQASPNAVCPIAFLHADWQQLFWQSNNLPSDSSNAQEVEADSMADEAAEMLFKASAATPQQVHSKILVMEQYISVGSGHDLVAVALANIKLALERMSL